MLFMLVVKSVCPKKSTLGTETGPPCTSAAHTPRLGIDHLHKGGLYSPPEHWTRAFSGVKMDSTW